MGMKGAGETSAELSRGAEFQSVLLLPAFHSLQLLIEPREGTESGSYSSRMRKDVSLNDIAQRCMSICIRLRIAEFDAEGTVSVETLKASIVFCRTIFLWQKSGVCEKWTRKNRSF